MHRKYTEGELIAPKILREVDFIVKRTARKLTDAQLKREKTIYNMLPEWAKRVDTKSGVITNLTIFVRRVRNREAASKSRNKKSEAVHSNGRLQEVVLDFITALHNDGGLRGSKSWRSSLDVPPRSEIPDFGHPSTAMRRDSATWRLVSSKSRKSVRSW